MLPVDAQVMLDIAPRFSGELAERQAAIVAAVGEVLPKTLDAYDISSRLRIAHFLAQTCHESAGFRTTEEFASGEAYEGRQDLGNVQPGDGPRFKGRGLIQLTGRANYRRYGEALALPLEDQPQLAADPATSLRIACEYWKRREINQACDDDDLIRVTRLINGGLNGIEQRRALTTKAKTALARLEGLQLSRAGSQATHGVLRRGSTGEEVTRLQQLLRGRGFQIGIEGEFGAATELAVTRFQSDCGLGADGIVGPRTWSALGA
jgi:putative chitinase